MDLSEIEKEMEEPDSLEPDVLEQDLSESDNEELNVLVKGWIWADTLVDTPADTLGRYPRLESSR